MSGCRSALTSRTHQPETLQAGATLKRCRLKTPQAETFHRVTSLKRCRLIKSLYCDKLQLPINTEQLPTHCISSPYIAMLKAFVYIEKHEETGLFSMKGRWSGPNCGSECRGFESHHPPCNLRHFCRWRGDRKTDWSHAWSQRPF